MGKQEPADTRALYQAVGFIVVSWGIAEQNIDLVSNWLYRTPAGRRICKGKLPPLLTTPKIAFIRRCMSLAPEFSDLQSSLGRFLDELEEIKPIREDIVHGAVLKIGSAHIQLSRMDHGTPRLVTFTWADLRDHALRFSDLAERLGRYVHTLSPRFQESLPQHRIPASRSQGA